MTTKTFATFATWPELLDYIAVRHTVYYQVPLDYRPVLVSVKVRKDGRVRITPPYADLRAGFTADESHLSRFHRIDYNARFESERLAGKGV